MLKIQKFNKSAKLWFLTTLKIKQCDLTVARGMPRGVLCSYRPPDLPREVVLQNPSTDVSAGIHQVIDGYVEVSNYEIVVTGFTDYAVTYHIPVA